MIDVFWALLFAVMAAPLGHWTVTNRHNLLLSAKCALFLRDKRVRVSCAAIVRLQDRRGLYVLARTYRRPERYAPFGGAFKCFDSSRHALDEMKFEPQMLEDASVPHGIEQDLRGYLPGASIPRFLRWFSNGTDRESDTQCLKRELREELAEVGLGEVAHGVESLGFDFVREVIEPPSRVDGATHWELRIIRVYGPSFNNRAAVAFQEQLMSLAGSNEHLLMATPDQIRSGRAGQSLIAHHAAYLFTDQDCDPTKRSFSPF